MDILTTEYKEKMRSGRRSAPLLFISAAILAFLAFLSSAPLYGQIRKDILIFHIMGYNVENLSDRRHDTLKNDYGLLPDAARHRSYFKYKKKPDAIVRVIVAVDKWTPSALVVFCEVESGGVLHSPTRYSTLRETGYRCVITHSPDERGTDVVLLYQREMFKLLSNQSLPVTGLHKSSRSIRDALHVSGLPLNRDTLDVFVAYSPSHPGGAKASEPCRPLVAQRLKNVIDSLLHIRTHP